MTVFPLKIIPIFVKRKKMCESNITIDVIKLCMFKFNFSLHCFMMGTCEIQIISDYPEHECPAAIRTKDNTEIEDGGLEK